MWYVLPWLLLVIRGLIGVQVGWVLPFLWAGVWAIVTIKWVQISLRDEYAQWERAKWKA